MEKKFDTQQQMLVELLLAMKKLLQFMKFLQLYQLLQIIRVETALYY